MYDDRELYVVYSFGDTTRLAWLADSLSSLLLRGSFSGLGQFGQIGRPAVGWLEPTVSKTRLVSSASRVECAEIRTRSGVLGCGKFVRLYESTEIQVGRTSSTMCGGSTVL